METEVQSTIPVTKAPQKRKYLDINLTKHVQDLYAINYVTDERRSKQMRDIPFRLLFIWWSFIETQHSKHFNSTRSSL